MSDARKPARGKASSANRDAGDASPSPRAATPARFEPLALAPELLAVLGELGFTQPTPVQAQSVPALLAGKDLIGQSKTGSGKTAAFALPILQRLDLDQRDIQALVLCPTRELCAQVTREFRTLGCKLSGLAVLELAGGQPIAPQITALERGVHVAVGTPGRVLDHLGRDTLVPRAVKTVVLDEADRMLDMGFGPDVQRILRALPDPRQTVLFSATMPRSVRALSREHQRAAVQVTIEEAPEAAAPEIRQARVVASAEDSLHALLWVLHSFPHEQALIFCNFKATVRDLAAQLSQAGFSVGRLDGDLDQFYRDQMLARFRNQSVRLLIATDVAGRGIDVPELELVINYELPQQPDVYVHRIGRTGRAGQAGVAVSLMTPRQDGRLRAIEALTGTPLEKLPRDADNDPGLARLLEQLPRDARFATVQVSAGRKHKVRPGDLLGALTGEAGGLAGADIGKIEMHDRLSYVAVVRGEARHAVHALNVGRIKGKRYKATLIGEVD
ncbi:MAG: ATP-dependent RNA helicase [Planctomycetota bacterium]|nr:MAG: ATP-dependent RNA helicase [Planctomycetota bacterium]